ncbi:MAG: DUF6470 family protein [Oscillospiraceae bacterium]|nr:DUF6470 family protein [Oscillospiraceae bacterium]
MNPNLLNITTIPITIKVNIVKAQLNTPLSPPAMIKVKTGEGGFTIDAQPAKINIDTYSARSSLGYGNYKYADFNKAEAQRGIKLAYQGVAKIVNNGDALVKGATAPEIAVQEVRARSTVETVMDFLPKEGADVTFDKGEVNINYHVRDVDISWDKLARSKFEFVPGKIEFIVEQMPGVEIEYLGKPIYVPPSAAPDYDG